MKTPAKRMVAVDVGNSSVSWQVFAKDKEQSRSIEERGAPTELTSTVSTLTSLLTTISVPLSIQRAAQDAEWAIGSVNSPVASLVHAAINRVAPNAEILSLDNSAIPLPVKVNEPDRVGIDRLLAAFAASRMKPTDRPAIVVDSGSAITVDLVSSDGEFEGGAILPGVSMASEALHTHTDQLPNIRPPDSAPTTPGRNTQEAIASGLYWGSLGAIQRIGSEYAKQLGNTPVWVLTGGCVLWANHFPDDSFVIPNLVLIGIANAWAANSNPNGSEG